MTDYLGQRHRKHRAIAPLLTRCDLGPVALRYSPCAIGLVMVLTFPTFAATLTPAQNQFFETRVRPLLAEKCYKCHSLQADKIKAGLLLDSRDGVLKGGETGPALVPGDPDKSLLI